MKLFAYVVVAIFCFETCSMLPDIIGYYRWGEGNRTELYCPNSHAFFVRPDTSCACFARRCWDITPDVCPMSSLQLERTDIFGNSNLVGSNNSTFQKFIYTNGRLTKVPDNICSFSERLVILDLSDNRLTNVLTLQCLHNLDTLLVDNNIVTELDNNTFSKMKDLRIISFKNNLIKSLGPNVIKLENGNILSADFSDNTEMEKVDITNVVHAGPFCVVNFTNTPLEELPNEQNYTITHTLHGPGDAILENTNIGSFLNFSNLGVNDLSEIGKHLISRAHMDESSVACDTTVYRILSALPDSFGVYWPNILGENFICQSPDSMKGRDLVKAYRDGSLDDITVDISDNPACPSYRCQCIERPGKDNILVNCTSKGFNSMPLTMPTGSWGLKKIDLILVKNDIKHLEYRDYLKRLVNLDLSENPIRYFDERAVEELHVNISINNQQLVSLPVAIKDTARKLYTFGDNPIPCDCSNLWIGDWVRFNKGNVFESNTDVLKCSTSVGVMAAEYVHDYTLGCRSYQRLPQTAIITSITVAITFLVMVIGLCFIFKHDITLLKRRLQRKSNNASPSTGIYDVFISFNSGNSEVFGTVKRYLQPALEDAGYTMFVPCFDIITGDVDLEMITAVDKSRNFVVVLGNGYADNFETKSEFEAIWTSFIKNDAKMIIVIDFEKLDSGSVNDRRIKALRRTKYCLDFLDRDTKLTSRLFKLLGKPIQGSDHEDRSGNNMCLEDIIDDYDEEEEDDIANGRQGMPQNVFDRLNRPKLSTGDSVYHKRFVHPPQDGKPHYGVDTK